MIRPNKDKCVSGYISEILDRVGTQFIYLSFYLKKV